MKKKRCFKLVKSFTALAIASSLTMEAVAMPLYNNDGGEIIIGQDAYGQEDSKYNASFIEQLSNLNINYKDYLDSSAMFQLPEGVGDDEEISVIITLDVINLMDAYEGSDKTMSFSEYALSSKDAKNIKAEIQQEKEKILGELDEKGISYTVGEEYSTVLAGFELLIKAGDFKTTCQSLGEGNGVIVGEEYKVAETELVENTVNVYDTGIFDSSDSGYDGSGMVVAVLDTGLDSAHTAFSVDNFTSETLGLTYSDVAALIDKTTASELVDGLSVDDVYINEKVPFGFDYADNDPDVYSTHNNHGTHVSGVIVGKDDTITGVAPNAQLVSMKIFSDVVDTARTSWILAALEDCVVLDVDVINMSLGTACGFSRESDEEVLNGVYDKIRESGISMIVAASNSYSSAYGSEANGNLGLTSNPDTGTVGSPSTYKGVMSVASISGVETPYLIYDDTIIYFTESTNSAAEENKFVETLLGDESSIEIEYVVVPGVGRSADYTGLDVEGKIALVRRGSNTFEEKAIIAQEQGAAGIIIYNNVSGDIKMNVGDATLAVCSISQDDGETLAAAESGTITISKSQTSGPFISDFSSWGPTPDLLIKPEITAHGGSILSSVTGGSYERLSGTSMACPNLAGVVILLRQYVVENFPEIADDNVKVTEMVYRLMMSTADIAFNKNGQPYAVRKQGAGLANLLSSIETTAYLTTYDKEGNAMDKTKLELGDDPNKNGVYEIKFTINNFGSDSLTYDIGAYVMTEGVSETKTNAGETTVTEEAYILDGATISIDSVSGGDYEGTEVTVEGGENADVTMTITLSDDDKKYLDDSFENGMYVEGFVTLTAVEGTDIDMNIPYLAFYGDWTKAPLFDLDYYETNADELDDGIDAEDKTMADAYASRPIGGVSEDYVSYLGSYYFLQDPEDIVIPADREHISLSNQEGTIHSLRYVWAGLLRNAAKIEITITDDVTGEVVFETEDIDVRKSYGDGGSIYPANIEIEFDTMDYNLKNNTEYTVKLVGYMDYNEGALETNEKNTFEFPLYIDFEAPTITDVEYYYEYDSTLKKNRLYAKVGIYDNHYAMSSQIGYVAEGEDENGNLSPEMKTFEQYMTPVYSEQDSVTYVTYELTDYLNEIKNNSLTSNTFVVTCYDYALNYATYEIGLPDDYVDFYFESIEENIVISPNEVYSLEPLVYPATSWAELLEYSSSKTSVARVVNNKLIGVKSGKAIIKVQDPVTDKSKTFNVTVLDESDEGYVKYDKPVADVFRVNGYYTAKAYYILDNNDKEIGDTGSTNFFEGKYDLSLYPSESVILSYTLDSYFPKDTTVEFESSNESIVKVDALGAITGVAEGFASVTVKVMMDGESTYYSETISVEVKDPYVQTGASLTHYYGNGGLVTIPDRLSLTEIGSFAFSNFEYIAKTEEELAFDDAEATKQWFIGDNTITKVIIPEGVKKISAYAFANLTALEEVTLPSTLEHIDYGAFYGCSSLQKISFSSDNNLKIINQNAFEGCDLQGTLELSSICVISDYAFAGNTNLEEIILSDTLLSIGQYAFASCKKLSTVTIDADYVKYGAYAFTDCEALTSFYVNSAVLPEGMFYECESMTSVTIGPDVNDIGEFAFRDTAIATFEISADNTSYMVQTDDHILSADGTILIAVAPTVAGEFTSSNINSADVTVVGGGAFSHNTKITSITLENVTEVLDYAFASNKSLVSVKTGALTTIGEYAYFETGITELPDISTEMEIGKYAFAYSDITSVVVPNDMVIKEGVFSECSKLATVVIGDNVTVGKYAFSMNKDESFDIFNYVEDGEKYFYYDFATALTSLTIGENAVIEDNAFMNAASITDITLGANAKIGYMAFYNNTSLKNIDLSKAVTIGDYAFSGDAYYICIDDSMAYAAVSKDGQYMYTYHAPALESVDLSSAESIGEYAFTYCRNLMTVKLNSAITEIPQYAFADCIELSSINLENIVTIGDYAFMQDKLENVDLSMTESIGDYAFVANENLASVKFSEKYSTIGEGAFSYCEILASAENIQYVENIDDYGFAYTALVDVDLSGALSIGDMAFMKEEMTKFDVTLGDYLEEMGDNPFAMCDIEPFYMVETESFAGSDYENKIYDYDLSTDVKVVDGSLYCKVKTGWELVTFTGVNTSDVQVADDTVRITSMAFAESDIKIVRLPYTVAAIGHKAFFGCDNLETVVFTSYEAPILEEEFDPAYYDCLEHIPGSGDYGTYTDYDGTEVKIEPMELIPYFMWNVSGGMYSNVFYGANFVDYVGYVEDKLMMVKPVNGQGYNSYVMAQYFDTTFDGAAAADDTTLAAIAAIDAIPEKVMYEDKALVEAAREAYNKIATTEQQALVTNYSELVSAEQRIIALTPATPQATVGDTASKTGWFAKAVLVILVMALVIGGFVFYTKKYSPDNKVAVFFINIWKKIKELFGKLKSKIDVQVDKLKAVISKRQAKVRVKQAEENRKIMEAEAKRKVVPMQKPEVLALINRDGENAETATASNGVIKIAAIAAAALVCAFFMVKWIGSGCAGEATPYEINNEENFGLSVKYDANGGTFTTNTSVIVDSFNVVSMADGSDSITVALVAPDNAVRGNDAFAPVKNGYFLAGWYANRSESTDADGNVVYTYSDMWDFDNDTLTLDADVSFDANEPVMTLYAAWVPLFEIAIHDLETGEYIDSLLFDPTSMDEIKVPQWDEEEGIMEMYKFPDRNGYTFEKAYYDAEGTKAVDTDVIEHTGSVNYETGTANNNVMKLYVEWTEGEWYHIYTAEQFAQNANVNGCYEIYADLDFTEESWPTALMYGDFTGVINGNGHTFKNIQFEQTNNAKVNAGLFGNITETANISDVTFENVVFTIKSGTRVAGTFYGLLAGKIAEEATLSGIEIIDGKLQIDSECYFSVDDYTIGLVCGEGNPDISADISCVAVGDNPKSIRITVDENGMVTLEFRTE